MAKIQRKEESTNVFINAMKLWYKGILSGVSYIIPIIVIGGLTIGFLNLIFGYPATHNAANKGLYLFYNFGLSTISLMIPVLAAYIAYGMVGKPGIAPGFVGGLVAFGATFGKVVVPTSGFIGGILAGGLAGFLVLYSQKLIKVPKSMESVKALIIIPLLSAWITLALMLFLFGPLFSGINTIFTDFLKNMSGSNILIVGLILGAMANFDFGGPINKVAYIFCIGMWTQGSWEYYAAFTAAKCIPGVTVGLASLIAPKYFTQDERNIGPAALILGICGIGEGVIPFALRDPLSIIPAQMLGGAVSAGLILSARIKIGTGAGGALFMVPLVDHPYMWIIYFLIGSAIATLGMIFMKKRSRKIYDLATTAETL